MRPPYILTVMVILLALMPLDAAPEGSESNRVSSLHLFAGQGIRRSRVDQDLRRLVRDLYVLDFLHGDQAPVVTVHGLSRFDEIR